MLVGGNPWVCDCALEWLKSVNSNHQTSKSVTHQTSISLTTFHPRILDLDTITCHMTDDYLPAVSSSDSFTNSSGGVPLLQMRSEQLLCEYSHHCIPACFCCDFFACDCRMQCPEGESSIYRSIYLFILSSIYLSIYLSMTFCISIMYLLVPLS